MTTTDANWTVLTIAKEKKTDFRVNTVHPIL